MSERSPETQREPADHRPSAGGTRASGTPARRIPARRPGSTAVVPGRRLGAVPDEAPSGVGTSPGDLVGDLDIIGAPRSVRSSSGAFPDPRGHRRYRIALIGLIILAVVIAGGMLTLDNPMPIGTRGFWLIAEMRATSLVVMAVVALCQAVATITFQTVTTNRIITPSIMGFESLYRVIQTGAVYFLGVAGVVALQGTTQFLLQVAAMVGLSVLLYGWLLRGKYANIQVMLLVGIIIGGGMGAVSTFMQRLLTPSEFDVLAARLFGSVTNASSEYLPYAIPLVLIATALIWLNARRLNVIALGRDVCINVGVDHGRQTIYMLVLVSVLMAVSTALVGPMTFFGFLVATLTYQIAGTHDHRLLLPVGALAGFVILAGAYFVMQHVFYAQGVVSIIIEFVGGCVFLAVVMRKGRL